MTETPLVVSLVAADAAALEAAARELIAKFRQVNTRPQNEGWQPDRPVVARLSGADIVGPMWAGALDPRTDRVIRRSVSGQEVHFELDQHACAELEALAERWAVLPSLAGLTTLDAMRNRLQRWCAAVLIDRIQEDCVPFVLAVLEEDLDTHEIWIQLSGIDTEHRFQLGKVELCGIDIGVIDAWLKIARDSGLDEPAIDRCKATLIRRWQGHTAAVYRAYGDQAVVQRDAAEEVQRACALLRAVNPRGSSPTSRSFLQPLEFHSQSHIRLLLTNPTKTTFSMQERPWESQNTFPDGMRVTRERFPDLWVEGGLVHIHNLLSSKSMNDFQRDVMRSLLIFSRQHLTVDPVEKTLFTISALETLLFAGRRGLDQLTTKRRLSGFLAGTLEMKVHVFTCVKAAYRFRNAFLHHGHSIADIRDVEDFLIVAWCFFFRAIAQHDLWPNSRTFCVAVDEQYRQRFGDDTAEKTGR